MEWGGGNNWKTSQMFIQSSLEVFWNGQKIVSSRDYNFIDDYTIGISGSFDYNDIVKRDIFICNYLVKI